MKKMMLPLCCLMMYGIALGVDEYAVPVPKRSVQETATVAYHRALEIRTHHKDGIPHEHHNARVMMVTVHNGREKWIDLGSVVEASPELLEKIEQHAVIAPLCGKDPYSQQPVLAILIAQDNR